jgi:choline dehydrogenase-like flavoprotein
VNENANADILIVGSGMGGATLAAGLAPTGARILMLECGERLPDTSETRDARAIFQRGVYRPAETWIDGAGSAFVDASVLPTSAGVNPALTIAAQALRVADHIARNDL